MKEIVISDTDFRRKIQFVSLLVTSLISPIAVRRCYMKSTSDKGTSSTPQIPVEPDTAAFDFDRWAVAVKRQMIAALKRKGIS